MKSVKSGFSNQFFHVLGITVDHELLFTQQHTSSMKALEQKTNTLKPFGFACLNCKTSKKRFTQVIIPKAMYAANCKAKITKCIKQTKLNRNIIFLT